jgi:uncharacterized membrane protein YhhN
MGGGSLNPAHFGQAHSHASLRKLPCRLSAREAATDNMYLLCHASSRYGFFKSLARGAGMDIHKSLAPWLLRAAVFSGLSYVAIWGLGFAPTVMVLWKGAGVALLALWAATQARDQDGWLLTAVMAFGAAGDVLLETSGLMTGAAAFAVGHLVAIWLYARNRRAALTVSQRLLAVLIIPSTVIIAYVLPADRSAAPGIAFYALLLSGMTAMAWTSRFPRYRTGIGAMMFVASDLLIFARLGPIADTVTVGVAIWLLYFIGQWLIAVGVRSGLNDDTGD